MASQNFTASGLYTPDAGVGKVLVQVFAGGSGSGAGSATNGGGGGGGGSFAQTNLVSVSVGGGGGAGGAYVVTVGAAVAAAAAGNQSFFTTTAVAPTSTAQGALAKAGTAGGAGGVGSNGAAGTGGPTATSIGDVKRKGGEGAAGQSTSGGGGGAGAGTNNAGGDASTTSGGTGGTVGGGNGGNGGGAAGAGVAGSAIGGAGGGGGSVVGAGATGARGEVRVTEVLEVNKSDNVTVTESVQLQLVLFVNKSDNVTITEATQFRVDSFVNVSDSVSVDENLGTNLVVGTFEDGTTESWLSADYTLTNTSAQAKDGTKSLQLQSLGTGGRFAVSAPVVVTVGQVYEGHAWFRTAVTARAINPTLYWYSDTAGVTFISATTGTLIADTTGGWTLGHVVGTAPATAIRCRFGGSYVNSALNEIHYIDTVSLAPQNASSNPFTTLVYNVQGISDAATVTEAVAFTLVLNATVSESITITEFVSVFKLLFVSASESTTLSESLKFTLVDNITVSENLASGTPPPPVPATYILLDNGKLAILVADISPYPLYQRL